MQPAVSGVNINATEIIDSTGRAVNAVSPHESYLIKITLSAHRDVQNLSVGYNVKLASGIVVYGTSSAIQRKFYTIVAGEKKVVRFSLKPNLTLGTYYLSAGAAESLTPDDEIHNYVMLDFVHDAVPFVVVAKPNGGLTNMNATLVSFERKEAP